MFKQSLNVMRKMVNDRQKEMEEVKRIIEEVKETDFYYKSYDKAIERLIEGIEKLIDEVERINERVGEVEGKQEYVSKEVIELLAQTHKIEEAMASVERKEEGQEAGEKGVLNKVLEIVESQNKAIISLSRRLGNLESALQGRERKDKESENIKNKKTTAGKEGVVKDKEKKEGKEYKLMGEEEIKKEIIKVLKNMSKEGKKAYVGEVYESYFKNKIKKHDFYSTIRVMEKEGVVKAEKEGTKKYVYL